MRTLPTSTLLTAPYSTGITCPRCGSAKIIKNGTFRHRQNFICKECKKTLSTHTGTAISGIHKRELFMQYTQCLADGLTIRQAAKQLGIAVSTSFAWRHKHLCALCVPKPESFQPVRSLSVFRTKYSEKGSRTIHQQKPTTIVKNIVCADLQGNTMIKTFKTSKRLDTILQAQSIHRTIHVLKPNSQLAYAAQRSGLEKGVAPVVKKMHATLAAAMEIKLNDWLEKFRGVSTKYLQRYWNWFSNQDSYNDYLWNSVTKKDARTMYLSRVPSKLH